MGENETLTLKQVSEKRAFLVAFLTLSRYCLDLTLDQIYLPKLFVISPLPDCPTESEQCFGLGARIHEEWDGISIKLVSLEKITLKLH